MMTEAEVFTPFKSKGGFSQAVLGNQLLSEFAGIDYPGNFGDADQTLALADEVYNAQAFFRFLGFKPPGAETLDSIWEKAVSGEGLDQNGPEPDFAVNPDLIEAAARLAEIRGSIRLKDKIKASTIQHITR